MIWEMFKLLLSFYNIIRSVKITDDDEGYKSLELCHFGIQSSKLNTDEQIDKNISPNDSNEQIDKRISPNDSNKQVDKGIPSNDTNSEITWYEMPENIDLVRNMTDFLIRDTYQTNSFLKSDKLYIAVDFELLKEMALLMSSGSHLKNICKYNKKESQNIKSLDKLKILIFHGLVKNILPKVESECEASEAVLFMFKGKKIFLCSDASISYILKSDMWCNYNSCLVKSISSHLYLFDINPTCIADRVLQIKELCLLKQAIEHILNCLPNSNNGDNVKGGSTHTLIDLEWVIKMFKKGCRIKDNRLLQSLRLLYLIKITSDKMSVLDGIHCPKRHISQDGGKLFQNSFHRSIASFKVEKKIEDLVYRNFNSAYNIESETEDKSKQQLRKVCLKNDVNRNIYEEHSENGIHDSGLGESVINTTGKIDTEAQKTKWLSFCYDQNNNLLSSTLIERNVNDLDTARCKNMEINWSALTVDSILPQGYDEQITDTSYKRNISQPNKYVFDSANIRNQKRCHKKPRKYIKRRCVHTNTYFYKSKIKRPKRYNKSTRSDIGPNKARPSKQKVVFETSNDTSLSNKINDQKAFEEELKYNNIEMTHVNSYENDLFESKKSTAKALIDEKEVCPLENDKIKRDQTRDCSAIKNSNTCILSKNSTKSAYCCDKIDNCSKNKQNNFKPLNYALIILFIAIFLIFIISFFIAGTITQPVLLPIAFRKLDYRKVVEPR